MTTATQLSERPAIEYPDSDGLPMADNTLQYEWIVTIKGGLDAIFVDDPNVFVAGDLLWYPVKGDTKIRRAPDAMVAFGRPKGYRGSYKQWEEEICRPRSFLRSSRQATALLKWTSSFNSISSTAWKSITSTTRIMGPWMVGYAPGIAWSWSRKWRVSSVRG